MSRIRQVMIIIALCVRLIYQSRRSTRRLQNMLHQCNTIRRMQDVSQRVEALKRFPKMLSVNGLGLEEVV
jgi:hypothetical protein